MFKRIQVAALALFTIASLVACSAQLPVSPDASAQSGKAYAIQHDFTGSSGQGIMAPAVNSKGQLVVASQANGATVVLTMYDTSGKRVSQVTTDVIDPATNFTLDAKDTAYVLAGSNVDILDDSGKTVAKVPVGNVLQQQVTQQSEKPVSAAQTSGQAASSSQSAEQLGMAAIGFAASSDGNIFLSFETTGVVQVDKTGKQVRTFGAGSLNLICMNDKEQLVVCTTGQIRPTLTTYDTQSGSQIAQQNISFNAGLLFYDRQVKRALYMNNDGIYPVKADGVSGSAIVALSNFPLSSTSHNFAGFAMDGAQTIYVASSDASSRNSSGSGERIQAGSVRLSSSTADHIDRLALVDASIIPQKKTLTIAGLMEGGGVDEAIDAFQKAHPDYQINLKTYDNQVAGIKGSGQSADTLIQQFNTDVIANNGADVYILYNLPYDNYIQNGLLADLGPMMAADKMDSSQYYSNIWDACKVNGKQYVLPTAFSFDSFIGNPSYMPANDTPTMDDFLKTAETLPAGVAALPKEDALQALSDYMNYSVTYFVDLNAKTAKFGSPEFVDILNQFITIANTKMGSTTPQDQDPLEQVGDGNLAFSLQDIRRLDDFSSFMALAGGNVKFESMPSMVPNIYSFRVRDLFGVGTSSPNKNMAWEFLKTLLSTDIQSNMQDMNGFPVNKAALQDMIQKEVSGTGSIESNGDRQVEVKPLTQAQYEAFTANFNKLNTTMIAPGQKMDDIMSVLKDELPAFFSGQKTAQSVAQEIQNRVETIINE